MSFKFESVPEQWRGANLEDLPQHILVACLRELLAYTASIAKVSAGMEALINAAEDQRLAGDDEGALETVMQAAEALRTSGRRHREAPGLN